VRSALYSAAVLAAFATASIGAAPSAALAASDHRTFDGTIVHISGNNLKVRGLEGGKYQIISFEYLPRFGKMTHVHGKTTTDEKDLHVGEFVRVTYDQKFLGLRHADSVEIEANPAEKIHS
jgi:hypothetical protein